MEPLEGKLVVDSDGKVVGEIETVTEDLVTIVRGVTRIERVQVSPERITSIDEKRALLQNSEGELDWKDIGVRCENCGKYVLKPRFEMGHYFCSKNCKNDFAKNFQTRFAKR